MSFQKIIYIHVNKCGGTSVKKVFNGLKHISIPSNDNIIDLIGTGKWNNSVKVTIVRNPYDRVKSLYKMLLRDNKFVSIERFFEILVDASIDYKMINGKLPTGDSYIKRHCLPLSHEHYGLVKDDKIIIDHVFKLENIKTDWSIIQKICNCKSSLPKKNISNSKSIKFSKEQIEIINNYYNLDFKLFQYKKKFNN
jgi:hypothetical protein